MQRWRLFHALVLSLIFACFARGGVSAAATVPYDVVSAVHGRVVGWAKTGADWFVVYVDRRGGDWCGLRGASWRMAPVGTTKLPVRVVADRRIGGAMCGNELAWVRAGRFSDGAHREVAFMLWTTPSIGAWTYVYRVSGATLSLLARFAGDRVLLGRGTDTVRFENRGRSPHGEIEDVYRFSGGHYRLVRRRWVRRAWRPRFAPAPADTVRGGAVGARLRRRVRLVRAARSPAELQLGRSQEGRPIVAIRAGDREGTRVLVVGCIHGTECAGLAVAHALERVHAHADLWIVPNLNPDGYATGTRQNGRGVDLNANWSSQWRGGGRPWDTYYPGPRPFSERETRIARNLILRIRPRLTIWFHQHMNLVWAFGPSTAAGRIYARAAGMRFYHHHWLDGTATNWQNHHLPGPAAFTVELPAGNLTLAQVRRQVHAVLTVAAALRGRATASSRRSG